MCHSASEPQCPSLQIGLVQLTRLRVAGRLYKVTGVKVHGELRVLCTCSVLLLTIPKEGWPLPSICNLRLLLLLAAPRNGLSDEAGCISDFGSEENIDLGCALQGWMSGHPTTLQTESQPLND